MPGKHAPRNSPPTCSSTSPANASACNTPMNLARCCCGGSPLRSGVSGLRSVITRREHGQQRVVGVTLYHQAGGGATRRPADSAAIPDCHPVTHAARLAETVRVGFVTGKSGLLHGTSRRGLSRNRSIRTSGSEDGDWPLRVDLCLSDSPSFCLDGTYPGAA